MTAVAHRFVVQVYHEGSDAMGIVHRANVLRCAERAPTVRLRRFGLGPAPLRQCQESRFAVGRCAANCPRQAIRDDTPSAEIRVTGVRGARLHFTQAISLCDELAVRLAVTPIAPDEALRRVRIARALPRQPLRPLPAQGRGPGLCLTHQPEREEPSWTN